DEGTPRYWRSTCQLTERIDHSRQGSPCGYNRRAAERTCQPQQLADQTQRPLIVKSDQQGLVQNSTLMTRWHHSRYDVEQTAPQHITTAPVAHRWLNTHGTLSDQPRRQVVNTTPARLTSEHHTKRPTRQLPLVPQQD